MNDMKFKKSDLEMWEQRGKRKLYYDSESGKFSYEKEFSTNAKEVIEFNVLSKDYIYEIVVTWGRVPQKNKIRGIVDGKNYHLFIPVMENNEPSIIHWSETLPGLRNSCYGKGFMDLNPNCRLLDPKTFKAIDIYLSEIFDFTDDQIEYAVNKDYR